ncbi:hypothetical protein AA102526_0326 [Asaia lannensis NBRC 102526]|nr:hypothetical protein AA102526_0326 [Asaia lannensis NBRC 102526]
MDFMQPTGSPSGDDDLCDERCKTQKDEGMALPEHCRQPDGKTDRQKGKGEGRKQGLILTEKKRYPADCVVVVT